MKPLILKQDLLAAFRELGMRPGMTVMVHTSLSNMGYVCGGAPTVIEALLETIGSEGTVMMPTQSWKNLDPEVGVHPEVREDDWQTIRDNWPAYDKNTSLHLADARADYPSKHLSTEHSAVMENGKRVWKAYDTLYVDGEDFILIGEAFEQEHIVSKVMLGHATLRLMRQRELVDFAVRWIEKYRK